MAALFWLVLAAVQIGCVLAVLKRLARQCRAAEFLGGGCAADDSAGQALAGTVRLLSHNLWLHYLVLAPGRGERIGLFLERLRGGQFDVVVVQEAFLLRVGPLVFSGWLEALTHGMRELGYTAWTDPYASLPAWLGQNSGVVVYATRGFAAEPTACTFTRTERLNNKGYVTAALAAANLTVIGTHLSATDSVAKLSQLRQLAAATDAALSGGGDVIVTGDFNLCPRTLYDGVARYEHLCQALPRLRNAFADQAPPRFCSFRWKPSNWQLLLASVGLAPLRWPPSLLGRLSGESLDHMFYSGQRLSAAHARVVDWHQQQQQHSGFLSVSDHLGIACDFHVSK